MDRIRQQGFALRALLRVERYEDYHAFLLRQALEPYLFAAKRAGRAPGRLLALGAGAREAEVLSGMPFESVVLSGIAEPDAEVERVLERHPAFRYELANAEALPYASRSFDLVLGKEVLHHLARPVQGFYEMLRVCRRRAVFVEPWSCALTSALDALGWTTRFEREQLDVNLRGRDNHVYRWKRRDLESLLASYYLDSGSRCEARVGWLSSRVLMPRSATLRRALLAAGWASSWLPGAAGNLACVAIEPGRDLPPDPMPISTRAERVQAESGVLDSAVGGQ